MRPHIFIHMSQIGGSTWRCGKQEERSSTTDVRNFHHLHIAATLFQETSQRISSFWLILLAFIAESAMCVCGFHFFRGSGRGGDGDC